MERKLTAILCADVHGYSRLMGDDEEATFRTLASHREIIDRVIDQHHGQVVNAAGDSVLAQFASAVNAVQCGIETQRALRAENANFPQNRRLEFRIGVNLGDVIVNGEQIYGDGVNVAARLETLAEPGGICISGTVYEMCGINSHSSMKMPASTLSRISRVRCESGGYSWKEHHQPAQTCLPPAANIGAAGCCR
ncbi:MAG: adenylate/guanylate cyclase domain-containing protein [Deltaproteobacteria bacterium]|nr:adenylate/guanylate cyclase domain-containing protein [Deltaproteobacteria bacterium]